MYGEHTKKITLSNKQLTYLKFNHLNLSSDILSFKIVKLVSEIQFCGSHLKETQCSFPGRESIVNVANFVFCV